MVIKSLKTRLGILWGLGTFLFSSFAVAQISLSTTYHSWNGFSSFTIPSGESYKLLHRVFTIAPGLIWDDDFSERFSLSIGLHLFWGQASISSPSTLTTVTYSLRDTTVVGAVIEPTIWWKPSEAMVRLGLGFPVLGHYLNLPDPPSGYGHTKQGAILLGMQIETWLQSGSFFFNPQFGFVKFPNDFGWALRVGLVL